MLQNTSTTRQITEFARPEDGAWDTRNPKVFYFVTTGATLGGNSQTGRLYKLTLDSLRNPTGGVIEMVADSKDVTGEDGETARNFDNIAVDGKGHILIQEDPGGSEYIAKTWKIDPDAPSVVQIVESDRDRFLPGAPQFLTTNEESSGIIDVTDIVRDARWAEPYRRYYLADMQAHYNIGDAELVEGGQLYLISVPGKRDRHWKDRDHHDKHRYERDGDDRDHRDDD